MKSSELIPPLITKAACVPEIAFLAFIVKYRGVSIVLSHRAASYML